jgi:hypothetical protein
MLKSDPWSQHFIVEFFGLQCSFPIEQLGSIVEVLFVFNQMALNYQGLGGYQHRVNHFLLMEGEADLPPNQRSIDKFVVEEPITHQLLHFLRRTHERAHPKVVVGICPVGLPMN